MHPIFAAFIVFLWIFLYLAMRRAGLHAFRFVWGSAGLFVVLMITIEPLIAIPLARGVSALAGIAGELSGWFSAYFKYGIIFIESGASSMTLLVDFECSGVIEILAYLCILAFFDVYTPGEKLILGLAGFLYIMCVNALRIVLICAAVHFFGQGAYYIFHTFIGRFLFYGLSIFLYFNVFTRAQVVKMKVGGFRYGHD